MIDVIKVQNLTKNFGKRIIIDNLNMRIKQQEFVAIVGPSGCGKSTLLNILGLLEYLIYGKVAVSYTHMTLPTKSDEF